jgi:hypothetical protein
MTDDGRPFEHDVFVCYAEADNAVLPGGEQGWIDQLCSCLSVLLGQMGVTAPRVRSTLAGNLPTSSRVALLEGSATIVAVTSPAYIASEWSTESTLARAITEQGTTRAESLFVVERSPVERAQVSAYDRFHRDVFWEVEGGDQIARTLGAPALTDAEDIRRYYGRATDLATAIARRLRQLRGRPSAAILSRANAIRVFLAEVDPDLEERRREVERQLEQAGFDVVPRGRLPAEPTGFENEVNTLLAGCTTFVQLLGDDPTDDGRYRASSLRQLAIAALQGGVTVLHWRDPLLDISKVTNAQQRALLQRETVRAETISDFCQAVMTAARHVEAAPVATRRVFVDVPAKFAEDVQRIVSRYPTIRWDWHTLDMRKLAKLVKEFDGVIIYWGEGESDLTQDRYLIFESKFKAAKKSVTRLLIYDGPPPGKPSFKGSGWRVAVGRHGTEPELLRHFIAEIERAE